MIRKKGKQILLGCLAFFLCSSCTSGKDLLLEKRFHTDEYLPQYDMPLDYQTSAGVVCKDGDSYYYVGVGGSLIYYYDEVSQNSGVLCARPDCTHDTTSCNAYVNYCGLQIYDGMLYFMGQPGVLYRMNLDGSNRESVMNVRNLGGTSAKFAIHRGYIYTSVMASEVAGGQPKIRYTLCQQVLGQTDSLKTIFEQTYEQVMTEQWILKGNQLYLMMHHYLGDLFSNELFCYRIQNEKMETVWEETSEWYAMDFEVDDTGVDMLRKNMLDIGFQSVRLDQKTKTLQERFVLEDSYLKDGLLAEDSILWYGMINKSSTAPEYKILDLQGNIQMEGEFPSEARQDYAYLKGYGSDETGYILEILTMKKERWLLRLPYDGSSVQILISCKDNVNII